MPLLTHDSTVGGWPSSAYPIRPPHHPHGPAADTVRPAPRPPRGGYPPPPGPPPGRGGTPHGGGPRPPSDDDGGRRRPRKLLWTLVALLGLGLLAPVVAFLVGWVLFDVPSANQTAVTQVATFKYADGAELATIRPDNVNRTIVPLDQVPPHVRQAVLSAEDRSFYSNPGFDLTGIGRALWNQATGGVGGGSTITQQYVKVSTGQDSASLWRKYKEIVLAVKISQEQSKDQILENYLNVIYLGRGAYGIQAASQAYFGKDVKDLSGVRGRDARRHHPVAVAVGPGEEPGEVHRAVELRPRRHGGPGLAARCRPRPQQEFPAFLPEAPRAAASPATPAGTSTSWRWTSSRPAGSPSRRSTPRASRST